jgi:hypothetical protein
MLSLYLLIHNLGMTSNPQARIHPAKPFKHFENISSGPNEIQNRVVRDVTGILSLSPLASDSYGQVRLPSATPPQPHLRHISLSFLAILQQQTSPPARKQFYSTQANKT